MAAALGVLVAVGGGWVAYSELSKRSAPARPSGPTLVAAARPTALVLGSGLRDTAERLDAPYRLGVDRRFRFAKAVLLDQGVEAPAEWQQEFSADDPWSAEHPFPRPLSFEEAFAELRRLTAPAGGAAQAQPGSIAVTEDPERWITTPEAALAIIAHETRTSPRPQDPLAAAHAAISLLAGGVDTFDVADELGGLGLAWLALAEQSRGEERITERAVLALELGYAETAAKLGRTLTGGAWKARLGFDDRALATASGSAGLLWYRRQTELGRVEERDTWQKLAGSERFGLAGVASSLRSTTFAAMRRASASCGIPMELRFAHLSGADVTAATTELEAARSPQRMVTALYDARGQLIAEGLRLLGVSLATLSDLGRLDLWIQKAKERMGSPTAGVVFEKYAEALVTSCLGANVEYQLDARGIPADDRVKLGRAIFDSKRPLFAQMKTWAELRALASTSTKPTPEIIATAKTLDRLGARAKTGLFRDVRENLELNNTQDMALLRMLADGLDTRPQNLERAAACLAELSLDLRYKDFFYTAWAREGAIADQDLAAWWDRYRGATAEAPASNATVRQAALLSRLDPTIDDWAARQDLTRFLEAEHRDAEIPAVVKPWLEAHPGVRGFGREWALTTLAGVELRAGRAAQAWKTWQPLQDSYKLSTMAMGARIALASANFVAANDLSTRALDRYPFSPDALALRLRVLWSTHRAEAARDVMRNLAKVPTLTDLDPVRDTFVEIYSTKPPAEAREATAALVDSQLTRSFIEVLADRFRYEKHFEHCAAVLEVPSDSVLHQLQNDVWSYRCRKQTMGAEPALAWLGAKVPPELRAPMVMFAFDRHLPELLWALPQPGESRQDADADYLWAMRAASQLWAGEAIDPRVIEHFRKETRLDSYAAIGRYLTGFIDEKTVLTAATTPRHANEVAYFLGLKAVLDHRTADAIVWYRASVETQESRSLEYSLSKFELHRIWGSNRSLRSFAAAHSP